MQRNHWAVAPSTASPRQKHSKHWIFLLLQAAQAHLTCEGNKGKRVRYSPVRRNKPYRQNEKHLPQLPQPEFTGKSRMYKCGKYLDIVENSRKECSLWKIVENSGSDYTTQSAQNQHCSKCFYCRKENIYYIVRMALTNKNAPRFTAQYVQMIINWKVVKA
jgi:hypothetical protein